jgi:hypothetical protein
MNNWLADEMLVYEQLRKRAPRQRARDRWRPWNVGGNQG